MQIPARVLRLLQPTLPNAGDMKLGRLVISIAAQRDLCTMVENQAAVTLGSAEWLSELRDQYGDHEAHIVGCLRGPTVPREQAALRVLYINATARSALINYLLTDLRIDERPEALVQVAGSTSRSFRLAIALLGESMPAPTVVRSSYPGQPLHGILQWLRLVAVEADPMDSPTVRAALRGLEEATAAGVQLPEEEVLSRGAKALLSAQGMGLPSPVELPALTPAQAS